MSDTLDGLVAELRAAADQCERTDRLEHGELFREAANEIVTVRDRARRAIERELTEQWAGYHPDDDPLDCEVW